MNNSLKDHWNEKYAGSQLNQLGWYEACPAPSLQLIENCALPLGTPIIDVGSGASTLIGSLLDRGYQNLTAVDLSDVALEKAQTLLNQEQAVRVRWLAEDVTAPSTGLQSLRVGLWHDRAVFHFLTEDTQKRAYHALLHKMLLPGGFVIMAAFAPHGAQKCSGLPVQRHSAESLADFLGSDYTLLESLGFTYHMPSGDPRPYIYTRFQKAQAAA